MAPFQLLHSHRLDTYPELNRVHGPISSHAARNVSEAFIPWARSDMSLSYEHLLLARMDPSFKNCLQADYEFSSIRGTRYCVQHTVETGTSYAETRVCSSRSPEEMLSVLELIFILLHGAPTSFSVDAEF